MNDKQFGIIKFVILSNWIIFCLLGMSGFLLFSLKFALGIILGGLIVVINFHLLAKTLKNAFIPSNISSYRIILAKYYTRFIISGLIIFFVIATHSVHPLGLLIGLSVVIASIYLAILREIKNLIFKEAV
ncbi:MAG: ATP synthase subunit I [Deltaproteobacteria bacterium]|nr:ATP synthase subunit I [Deltaproteobacteria bacterium]